jgi:hypothetical protein
VVVVAVAQEVVEATLQVVAVVAVATLVSPAGARHLSSPLVARAAAVADAQVVMRVAQVARVAARQDKMDPLVAAPVAVAMVVGQVAQQEVSAIPRAGIPVPPVRHCWVEQVPMGEVLREQMGVQTTEASMVALMVARAMLTTIMPARVVAVVVMRVVAVGQTAHRRAVAQVVAVVARATRPVPVEVQLLAVAQLPPTIPIAIEQVRERLARAAHPVAQVQADRVVSLSSPIPVAQERRIL